MDMIDAVDLVVNESKKTTIFNKNNTQKSKNYYVITKENWYGYSYGTTSKPPTEIHCILKATEQKANEYMKSKEHEMESFSMKQVNLEEL